MSERDVEVIVAVINERMNGFEKQANERHTEILRRWDRHEKEHHAERLDFLEWCKRVSDLEKWAEAQKERTGTMARIAGAVSALVYGIGEVVKYLITRPPQG
jgi:hypothetical protein